MPRRPALASVLGLALAAVVPAPAAAQQLAPKRARLTAVEQRCAAEPTPRAPTYEQQSAASRLISEGDQALLLGDPRAARDAFARAAEADPRAPGVAYRLARTYEELDEPEQAAQQYCRYLALAPSAPDQADVLDRIDRLTPGRVAAARTVAELFDRGAAHLAVGRAEAAVRAFGDAIEHAPGWADAYFNRAVAEAASGQPRRAARDLRRYLELRPGAGDRPVVIAEMEALRALPVPRSPGNALARGLVVPGLGQFYTGRPVLGALILAGAGATYAMALREEEVTRTVRRTDPFGNPYDDEYVVRQRPDLGRGVALAAAITALGALEAFLYAQRADAPATARAGTSPARPRLSAAASDGALLVEWRVPVP